MSLTYKESGVDIDLGSSFVEQIKPLARSTAQPWADGFLGGFGGIIDPKKIGLQDPLLIASTDGVGTKVHIANILNQHYGIGIDLVAMCVNDILTQGAKPLIFLDYFSCNHLNLSNAKILMQGIRDGCLQSSCTLLGGETAEMPDVYNETDYDLSGFCVGAVERQKLITPNHVQENSIMIGLQSSGLHANGFSLIRAMIKKGILQLDKTTPFSQKKWGEVLLTPTIIYVKPILNILQNPTLCSSILGICHITGGGLYDNLPRVFNKNLQAVIYKRPFPSLFLHLKNLGKLDDKEMYRTFNCGIGMVLIIKPEQESVIKENLSSYSPITLGFIRKRPEATDSVIFI